MSATVGAVMWLLLAFGLLVLERQLAQENTAQWPEAGALAQLTRVAIISLVLGAFCLLFGSETSVWPVRLAVLIGLLPGFVAFELLLRAVLSLFSPRREQLEPDVAGAQFCRRHAALAATAIAGIAERIAQPLRHRPAADLGLHIHAPGIFAGARRW